MLVRSSSEFDTQELNNEQYGPRRQTVAIGRDANPERQGGLEGPQAILLEFLSGDRAVPPHFHPIDQFQIAIAGKGRVGKARFDPVTIHYSDGTTPYGPILIEEPGLSYWTLRAESSNVVHFMPGSRDKMEKKAGRHIMCSVPADVSRAPGEQTSPVQRLWRDDDGLGAFVVTLGPDEASAAVNPAEGLGQYFLLLAGSLAQSGNERLEPGSLLFVSPEEPAPRLCAGREGATLLMVQFPRRRDR